MQLAMMCLPQELFENLGLTLISPNDVIAAPGFLYDPDRQDPDGFEEQSLS